MKIVDGTQKVVHDNFDMLISEVGDVLVQEIPETVLVVVHDKED